MATRYITDWVDKNGLVFGSKGKYKQCRIKLESGALMTN